MAGARKYPYVFAVGAKRFVLERFTQPDWMWPRQPPRYSLRATDPRHYSLGEPSPEAIRSVRELRDWALKRLRSVQAKARRKRAADEAREERLSRAPSPVVYSQNELASVRRWYRENKCSSCGSLLGNARRAVYRDGAVSVAFDCTGCAKREKVTFAVALLGATERTVLERQGIVLDPHNTASHGPIAVGRSPRAGSRR